MPDCTNCSFKKQGDMTMCKSCGYTRDPHIKIKNKSTRAPRQAAKKAIDEIGISDSKLIGERIFKRIKIRKLQKNNIFYYAGKVYICGWVTNTAGNISAMETHGRGKHRSFKPDTKVLFISPGFMKKILRPQTAFKGVNIKPCSCNPKPLAWSACYKKCVVCGGLDEFSPKV